MLDVGSATKAYGRAQSKAASNRVATRAHPRGGHPPAPRAGRSPTYGRSRVSQPSVRPRTSGTIPRAPARSPARPITPIPSADAIADLFNQIAGFKREYGQLGSQYNLQRDQLGAARGLFLKQLADAFTQSRTGALQDYASRGLSGSGIEHEGLARLESQFGQRRAAYETDYRGQLATMLQTLQGRRADILARRRAIESQYNRLRAQRTAALKLAGFS